MALDRDFRVLVPGRQVPFYNNSGGALEEGDMVYDNSGTIAKVADNNTVGCLGIVAADVADGETGVLYIDGLFEATVAGTVNFAPHAPVYTASSSTVDSGSTSDKCVGYVMETDPPSGASTIKFWLYSTLNLQTTHA